MSSKPWPKFLETTVHLCLWAVVVSFPLFFWGRDHQIGLHDLLRFAAMPAACAIVFYTNYCAWVKTYLLQKKLGIFFMLNLSLILLTLFGEHLWHEWLNELNGINPETVSRKHGPSPLMFAFRNSAMLILTCALSVAIRMTSNWYQSEMKRQKLEKEHTEMALKNLKSQLHPHFLFNTLNNIYALVAIEPEKAQTALLDLSKLLRYVLKESERNTVPLSDEILFLQQYIRLMSLRIGPNVTLSVDFPDPRLPAAGQDPQIAPLLFINLIENAFKYGVHASSKAFINISMKWDAAAGVLEFTCSNPVFDTTPLSSGDTGIGIPNLRQRLEYLYPNRHVFELKKEGSVFLVYLAIRIYAENAVPGGTATGN
ncbi:MAG: histidine kinase [Bacteroidales bacterium]|nr:histidine kinase [Bacteroidales bacterium]